MRVLLQHPVKELNPWRMLRIIAAELTICTVALVPALYVDDVAVIVAYILGFCAATVVFKIANKSQFQDAPPSDGELEMVGAGDYYSAPAPAPDAHRGVSFNERLQQSAVPPKKGRSFLERLRYNEGAPPPPPPTFSGAPQMTFSRVPFSRTPPPPPRPPARTLPPAYRTRSPPPSRTRGGVVRAQEPVYEC